LKAADVPGDGIEMSRHVINRMREKPGGDAITVATGDMSDLATVGQGGTKIHSQ